mmetsp:Transcript_27558/g.35901  ORF Transcript_27558/g.35901 Transcript_27558/m.35901 type:complete len:110 (+) Transcript_27558:549-878(+)
MKFAQPQKEFLKIDLSTVIQVPQIEQHFDLFILLCRNEYPGRTQGLGGGGGGGRRPMFGLDQMNRKGKQDMEQDNDDDLLFHTATGRTEGKFEDDYQLNDEDFFSDAGD